MSNPIDREVAVFGAARRLSAGARAAYLDETCGGDEAFRHRVEELLRANEEAGGFLQDPAPGAQRPAGGGGFPNPLHKAAGAVGRGGAPVPSRPFRHFGRYGTVEGNGRG